MEDRIEQAKQTKNSRFYLGQARRSAQGSGEGAAQGSGEARTGAGAVVGTRRRSGGRARDAAHRGWDRRERRVRRGLPTAGRTASEVGAVGVRRRAVLGVEGRRGVGGGRGHQRWRRAGEVEELGSGGRRRGGKGDRGGKYRSPLQGDFCGIFNYLSLLARIN
jgi:hypothetical protein